jgi:alkyl hydroperoxide reductase subunit AhpC
MFSLRVFDEREGLGFPLLSDFWPHGAVARAYGVFDEERGCALRGTFVVDRSGDVRWSVVNEIPDARSLDELLRALAEVRAPAGG